jgi:hypothetical protein
VRKKIKHFKSFIDNPDRYHQNPSLANMSAREKSPASESSSSATPPPIGETAPPDATSSGGTANAGASGSAQAVPGAAPPGAFVMPPGMAMPPGMQFLPYFPQPAAGGAGGDSNDPNAPAQPQQMMIHPAFIPQMYSYSYPGMMAAGMKLKRRQVKNACTNCQKACKKCDDERPCPRCVKYGIADECQDSVRKERRKGIKRGSYKKKGEWYFLSLVVVWSFFSRFAVCLLNS